MKHHYLLLLLSLILSLPGTSDMAAQERQRLTNLPHIYINTFSGYSITSKTDYVYAKMWYVDEEDQVTFYDSLQIRGRGNSTWNMAKKPYKLKFKVKEKMLGKGYAKAKKWTLLANHGDKSLIRNAVTSLMGEKAGLKFNPAAKFVDLTLNNAYVGNYQLSDQIDVRPHRVNLVEQDYPLDETSDITGGYLLESDGFKDFHSYTYWDSESQSYLPPDGFFTKKDVPVRIHYPDNDELSTSQTNYIRQFIADFETILFSDDFADKDKGYRPYVDSLSLVNWYLCTEMSGNIDGFFSTYFYKEQQDDHLYWGPLWDYDIAYNNDNRSDRGGTSDTSHQLMSQDGYGMLKVWVRRLWQDPWFARLVNRRYAEIIDDGMEEHLNAKIDSLTQLMAASVARNYERWGINSRTLRERVLYSTYDEYVADLRSYIHVHLPYLTQAFAALLPEPPEQPEEPEVKVPDFPADPSLYYVIRNAGNGNAFDTDASSDAVVCNARDAAAERQQWQVIPLQNGYLYLVNRATGYVLNDPTEGIPTATTLIGAQLNTVAPSYSLADIISGDVTAESIDLRQQWDIVAQADEQYNLISRFSQHGANLSGGNSANGTPVLSYTSDSRNASSKNRMWRLEAVGEVPAPITDGIEEIDYALAYDPQSGRLHFGADDIAALRFQVRIFDHAGHLISTFRASDGTSLAALPHGIYLITWTVNNRQRTRKLLR